MHPFIKKAIELEALKFGDFTLKSGLKSKYFFNIASFFNGQDMHFLANQYFKVIQKANLEFDAMYGPNLYLIGKKLKIMVRVAS